MKFVDLFCGGGFGARGAVAAGAKPILAVDAWDLAALTYQDNFPEAEVVCAPIEDLDPFKLARKYQPDVLLTSPECTSHSIARGSKPGSEKSRETAIGIVPWVKAMNPRWVVIENVRRMKKWERHNELVETVKALGYTVSDLHLNAADFGAAQARKRMFLVCDRQGTSVTREQLLSRVTRKPATARDIIDWEGDHKVTKLKRAGRAQATLDRAKRAIAELGRNVPFIIVYYGSDYAGGWQTLDAPLRTITTIDRFALVTWQDGTPYMRMLQPNELVKAMCREGNHLLPHGNRRDKVKLCGNGVCSDVMAAIFEWMEAAQAASADACTKQNKSTVVAHTDFGAKAAVGKKKAATKTTHGGNPIRPKKVG